MAKASMTGHAFPKLHDEPLLLVTKLYVPPRRPNFISRSRLLAELDTSLGRPLTVISAPTGFGKTALVTDWLAHQRVLST